MVGKSEQSLDLLLLECPRSAIRRRSEAVENQRPSSVCKARLGKNSIRCLALTVEESKPIERWDAASLFPWQSLLALIHRSCWMHAGYPRLSNSSVATCRLYTLLHVSKCCSRRSDVRNAGDHRSPERSMTSAFHEDTSEISWWTTYRLRHTFDFA